jgi:hypothetical protein
MGKAVSTHAEREKYAQNFSLNIKGERRLEKSKRRRNDNTKMYLKDV